MTCYAHRSNIPLPPCSGMMAMLDGNRTLRASMISHPEPDWQLVHLGRREAAIPQSAIPRIPGNDHQCFRNGRCWTGTCRSRRSSRTSVLSQVPPTGIDSLWSFSCQFFTPDSGPSAFQRAIRSIPASLHSNAISCLMCRDAACASFEAIASHTKMCSVLMLPGRPGP